MNGDTMMTKSECQKIIKKAKDDGIIIGWSWATPELARFGPGHLWVALYVKEWRGTCFTTDDVLKNYNDAADYVLSLYQKQTPPNRTIQETVDNDRYNAATKCCSGCPVLHCRVSARSIPLPEGD